MLTYEISDAKVLREEAGCPLLAVRARIEEVIEQFGLSVFETTTLASLPDSIRYRMRQEPFPDVLEVVYWPLQHRLFVCACAPEDGSVQSLVLSVAQAMAQVFGGRVDVAVHHEGRAQVEEPEFTGASGKY
ncbi:MAG: hypothetical protein OWT28_06125 [Firmicutes bacterium]|nr:hypothetical protein [Bacillota bacterium]